MCSSRSTELASSRKGGNLLRKPNQPCRMPENVDRSTTARSEYQPSMMVSPSDVASPSAASESARCASTVKPAQQNVYRMRTRTSVGRSAMQKSSATACSASNAPPLLASCRSRTLEIVWTTSATPARASSATTALSIVLNHCGWRLDGGSSRSG
jgi:hypothetical protein